MSKANPKPEPTPAPERDLRPELVEDEPSSGGGRRCHYRILEKTGDAETVVWEGTRTQRHWAFQDMSRAIKKLMK